jgi:hypothetical protein
MPGYISSLSYTFDNQQTTWETAKLPEDMNLNDATIKALSSPGVLQLPKHIDVSVSFVPVGVYRPEFRGVMYSLYDDTTTGTNVETGLIPHNAPNRVNYFVEYEDKGTPVIYTGYDNGKPYAAKPIQTITVSPDPSDPTPEPAKSAGTETSGSSNEKPAVDGTAILMTGDTSTIARTPTSISEFRPSSDPLSRIDSMTLPGIDDSTLRGGLSGNSSILGNSPGTIFTPGVTNDNPFGKIQSTSTPPPPANTDKKDGKTTAAIPRPPVGAIPPSPLPVGLTEWVDISSAENLVYEDVLWSTDVINDTILRSNLDAMRKAALEGYDGIPPGKAAAVYYMRKTFGLNNNKTANVPSVVK